MSEWFGPSIQNQPKTWTSFEKINWKMGQHSLEINSELICINFWNQQTYDSSGFLKEIHNSLLNACSFPSQIFACVDSHPSFWMRQKINYGAVYLSNSIWIYYITNIIPNGANRGIKGVLYVLNKFGAGQNNVAHLCI